MSGDQEIHGVSLVVVGGFNPPIFSPGWLASEQLIRENERDTAIVEVIHPEIASFSIGAPEAGPIKIQVVRQRLYVSTEDPRKYEVIRDLISSILGVLRHTPVHQLGINVESHVPKGSAEALNEIGDLLAPKGPWAGTLERPLLMSMSMKGQRQDLKPAGAVTVKVEPSARVRFGVVVSVNDHYELLGADLDETQSGSKSEVIQKILAENWTSSLARSRKIVERLGKTNG